MLESLLNNMSDNKKQKKQAASGRLHPQNPHSGRYDFDILRRSTPELDKFIIPNPKGDDTIDFTDADAVITLNKALLAHFYSISNWGIPPGYLCPPIPGRADYIHYLADLLPEGTEARILDIGTGASCIYPILGSRSYGWKFIATDIDKTAVKTAKQIVESNKSLKPMIKVVLQEDREKIFQGIIREKDRFHLTLCNPPFHATRSKAEAGTSRKWKNLGREDSGKKLNFGGRGPELWCPGGELAFLKRMINESIGFANQICWFTSLVSKGENIRPLKNQLIKSGAVQVKVVKMEQGQKISRFIAWSFFTAEQQKDWS